MNVINQDREAELREAAPSWVEMITNAKKQNIDYIITSLDAFADSAELLFNALWYANSQNVAVMFAEPNPGKGNNPPRVMTYLREHKNTNKFE